MGKVYETIEESISYRMPMRVNEKIAYITTQYGDKNKYVYPVCPRCRISFEQEYQSFCGHCGQRLNWRGYGKIKEKHSGINENG